ncbi:MBL fold metallo-hydrolase [Thiohalomonas denitrificans]|uniref:MBL fold metallo-hydrolase n=1 Tax=Thiohalomonas denitrificans TaxID=415747 RepID=UPI0029500287|nr:MBL fold metallo-hydrolase [Thiohalomonas denitrificans]
MELGQGMTVHHHGGVEGVTGSCHELEGPAGSVLIDCGLFQGADERSSGGLEIDFDLGSVRALVLTHCHLDHVGRVPYLFAAGFRGPVYCSEATAQLLPLVIEDALEIGFTRNRQLIEQFLDLLKKHTVAVPYGRWTAVPTVGVSLRLQPAGHILGSAYVEFDIPANGMPAAGTRRGKRVVFSGDLGAPHSPLLPAPKPPCRADLLVLESTYGDRRHEGRRTRRERLQAVVERCLENRGVVLIPAFSIGRTQELLYELEQTIHCCGDRPAMRGLPWREMEIVVDSPLAARFTREYRSLKRFWDQEARQRVASGRHPLAFEQLTTIDDHDDHLRAVDYLGKSGRPTVVIAASGMCTGGRVVNYLKRLLGDPRTDVLFVGYQAEGTPGRDIQRYGPSGGWVRLDGQKYDIRAGVHTLSGYSAHADQKNLVDFVARIRKAPTEVRLVHGEPRAREALASALRERLPETRVVLP